MPNAVILFSTIYELPLNIRKNSKHEKIITSSVVITLQTTKHNVIEI